MSVVVRDLPKLLAKVFDPKQVLNMTEQWQQKDDGYTRQSEITVEGQPVNVKTEVTLVPAGEGCVYTINYKAKAKIPLIGGKIEKFIISNCQQSRKDELNYTARKLSA